MINKKLQALIQTQVLHHQRRLQQRNDQQETTSIIIDSSTSSSTQATTEDDQQETTSDNTDSSTSSSTQATTDNATQQSTDFDISFDGTQLQGPLSTDLQISITPGLVASCLCPKGYENWVDDSNFCYSIHSDSVFGNFWQAEAICKYEYDGGRLIVVDTPEKNKALARNLKLMGSELNSVIDLQGKL